LGKDVFGKIHNLGINTGMNQRFLVSKNSNISNLLYLSHIGNIGIVSIESDILSAVHIGIG